MEFKGKPISLLAKVLATLFVFVGFCLMAFFFKEKLEIKHVVSLVIAAGFIVLIFLPVDISIWIDKAIEIAQLKYGKKQEEEK